MRILFEDEYIVVCIKPIGILSQEDLKARQNMVSLLKEVCKSEIYPLHRLDREVGGIMVFAKTKFSASILSTDIANRNFKKEYLCLVHGKPENEKGEMRDLLFKDSRKNKVFTVKRKRVGVKEALLEYETVAIFEKDGEVYSVNKILLDTGRTHQIRVQFASRKMSLIGDRKYGAKDDIKEIGLWSYSLTFSHPKTKQLLNFKAEPENIIAQYL